MFNTSMQPNMLLSPSSSAALKSSHHHHHHLQPVQYNSISSSTGPSGAAAAAVSSAAAASLSSHHLSSPQSVMIPSDIDDKSLKDCTDVVHRQVVKLKNMNEFSDVLQIENISIIYSSFIFIYCLLIKFIIMLQ